MNSIARSFISFFAVISFCAAFVLCNGCSKSEESRTVWTFANHSSVTVGVFHIAPSGQPDMLELAADTTADVTIAGQQIDYDYGPADTVVRARSQSGNVITFCNKE